MVTLLMVPVKAKAPAGWRFTPTVGREGMIGEEWNPLDETGLGLQPVPTQPGDVIFFDSFAPHASKPNFTDQPRRLLYLTYNLASQGDHRAQYYAEKHAAFPPDIERTGDEKYIFRV